MHLLLIVLIVLTIYCKPFRPVGMEIIYFGAKVAAVWIASASFVCSLLYLT